MSILLTKLLPDMDFQIQLAIILLLLPLFSFAILFFLGKYLPRKGDITASVLMGIATILSVYLFADSWLGDCCTCQGIALDGAHSLKLALVYGCSR